MEYLSTAPGLLTWQENGQFKRPNRVFCAKRSVAILSHFRIYLIVMPKASLDPKHFDALRKFKAGIFKVLAHPTRIHVIETLRSGELSVGEIMEQVKVEPANLSQHLSVLRQSHLVVTRKNGNQVLYRLRDPLLIEVLDAMRRYFQKHFEDSIAMLKRMEQFR
jgi:DNA-binding transcriptional ArsR family regulator